MALPPACSNCLTMLQLSQPGALPLQNPWQFLRAGNGCTRLNFGDMSIINNPAAGLRIVLDHLAQAARLMPLMPGGMPGLPGMPGMPGFGLTGGAALGAAMAVLELGKSIMQGEPVTGQRFTFPSGNIAEIWTNSKLLLPVLSTFSGGFGQQICRCSNTSFGEPDPSQFLAPPNYRTIGPLPAPSLPGTPKLPL